MGSLDFGKITTIVLMFFIVAFFFGGEIKYWYEHKDDLQFELKNISYTEEHYAKMEEKDKEALLKEVASLCVRKRYADNLNCDDTAYWLANSLEEEGVESNLAISWMQTCKDACETQPAPPVIDETQDKRKNIQKGTKRDNEKKWIWDE